MKYYLQINNDNIITDAINYVYGDYVEVDIDAEYLPAGINGGWWKWEDGEAIEHEELKPIEVIKDIQPNE